MINIGVCATVNMNFHMLLALTVGYWPSRLHHLTTSASSDSDSDVAKTQDWTWL